MQDFNTICFGFPYKTKLHYIHRPAMQNQLTLQKGLSEGS